MKLKTKDIVIAALLTSMSIIIPNFFPTFSLEPFSFTFASHLPVIVSMFISPIVAVFTAIGSVAGFILKCSGQPWIICRAAMHIPFAMLGAYMIKKNCNLALTVVITMIIHAILEVVIVLPFLSAMSLEIKTLEIFGMTISLNWYMYILVGTMIHHLIDFAIAMLVVPVLKKSGYVAKEKVSIQ